MKTHSEASRQLGFRIHAVAFAITMVVLAVINLLTGSPYWVLWVLPSWIIGILSHWWFVVGPGAYRNRNTPVGYALGAGADIEKREEGR